MFTVKPVLTASGWACEFSPGSAPPPDQPAHFQLQVETRRGGEGGEVSLEYLPAFSVATGVLEVGPAGGVLKVSGRIFSKNMIHVKDLSKQIPNNQI